MFSDDSIDFNQTDIQDKHDAAGPGVIIFGIDQGSQEWLNLRAGKISSSRISHMMAKGKEGLTRKKYLNQLAIERITGKSISSGFKSKSMLKGNEDEPLARSHYEFENDVDVECVTFVHHPFIAHAGASPDGLVLTDGALEIKCPDVNTHVEYLLSKKIPKNYYYQMQWQLACLGREWCDWMTYEKSMPMNIRSMIIKVYRDEKTIKLLEDEAERFNEEIEQLIQKLRS